MNTEVLKSLRKSSWHEKITHHNECHWIKWETAALIFFSTRIRIEKWEFRFFIFYLSGILNTMGQIENYQSRKVFKVLLHLRNFNLYNKLKVGQMYIPTWMVLRQTRSVPTRWCLTDGGECMRILLKRADGWVWKKFNDSLNR